VPNKFRGHAQPATIDPRQRHVQPVEAGAGHAAKDEAGLVHGETASRLNVRRISAEPYNLGVPQIQEPDDRLWNPLRVVFAVLLVTGVIYLASRGFVSAPAVLSESNPTPASFLEIDSP